LLLNTGCVPPSGSQLEIALLAAVLDGERPDVTSTRSLPAQVAVALTPRAFLATSDTGFEKSGGPFSRLRTYAISQLRRTAPLFYSVAKERALRRFSSPSAPPPTRERRRTDRLRGPNPDATHVLPWGNYVTGWGNYVIETPSNGGITRSPTNGCSSVLFRNSLASHGRCADSFNMTDEYAGSGSGPAVLTSRHGDSAMRTRTPPVRWHDPAIYAEAGGSVSR
jgi:hypothetical protein